MTWCYPFRRGVGRKTQRFGANPNNGINPAGGHTGDDWAVPEGTPIYAAGDGVIEVSGWPSDNYLDSSYWLTSAAGDALVLNCGDNAPTFIYGHNSDTHLPVGTRVRKGQHIGTSGNSGLSTGPHCHVEVMPPDYIISSPTYGRDDPENWFDEYVDDLPTENEDDMPLTLTELEQIQKFANANGDRVINHLVALQNSQFEVLVNLIGSKLDIDEDQLAAALLAKGDLVVSKKS